MPLLHRLIGGLVAAVASALVLMLWRPGGGVPLGAIAVWLTASVVGIAWLLWPIGVLLGRVRQSLRGGAERAATVAARMSNIAEAAAVEQSDAADRAAAEGRAARALDEAVSLAERAQRERELLLAAVARACEPAPAASAPALVKSIDDLAFELNLLSLNAARPGEVDLIVADSKRLADRAAAVARDAARAAGEHAANQRSRGERVAELEQRFLAASAHDATLVDRLRAVVATLGEAAVWRDACDAPASGDEAASTCAASAAEQLATQAGAMRQLARELEPLLGPGRPAVRATPAERRPQLAS